MLACFDLDRFVGFATEEELVLNSLSILDNYTLLGGKVFKLALLENILLNHQTDPQKIVGVVFISPSSSDQVMPEIVKYKIRQDTNSVTKTNRIQRTYVYFGIYL